jgi:hypothetical protein
MSILPEESIDFYQYVAGIMMLPIVFDIKKSMMMVDVDKMENKVRVTLTSSERRCKKGGMCRLMPVKTAKGRGNEGMGI